MRLARYEHGGGVHAGVVDGDGAAVRPLAPGTDPIDVLQRSPAERAALETGDPVPLAQVRLLPPLQPPTIRDFMTFERHIEGAGMLRDREHPIADQWYAAPAFYFTNPHGLVGAHDDVAIPPGCTLLDFELEVAAVIGRAGRNLRPEEAGDHIAGYAILNDWSARDLQGAEMLVGLGPAKGKDFALTLGPWIVTADELEPHRRGDRLDLRMDVSVNGVPFGGDTLAEMAWSFEELVAYASRGTSVQPGDVLGSGTCAGGCLVEHWGRNGAIDPPPLQAGDVVEMTVQGLGTIANTVVAGAAPHQIPPARRRGPA